MLAEMFAVLFDNNKFTEKWAVALDDAGGATASTGSYVASGTATADGTVYMYINCWNFVE